MAKKKQPSKKVKKTPSGKGKETPTSGRRKVRSGSGTKRAKKAGAGERFPIVGVGASAGGLEALKNLLEAMPDEPGIALVILQHLDPTKKSLTPELLARHTKMRMCEVEDEPDVKQNSVYVLPPDRYLSIAGGKLHLSKPDEPRGARMAIDFFLRSLADDQGRRAVGVILSGAGADGSLGVKAIKSAGGMVIAQDPKTAEFDIMPKSAITTGAVDHVLGPREMPDVILQYAAHPYVREPDSGGESEQRPELRQRKKSAAKSAEDEEADGLRTILSLLKARTEHDFHHYKDRTVLRRTKRRMCLHHFQEFSEYLEFLREHPEEVEALIKDLLISVTDFFRDPEAWEELDEQVSRIVEEKPDGEPIRVWVPGCATGEEPYSLMILLLERLHDVKKSCPLQVFASDVDEDALEFARRGRYPASIEADVSPERLKRFFTKEDDGNHYTVTDALRKPILFAEQNLINDPPFSNVDLICCRNLLIYLKPEVQEKLIPLFHFALVEGGYLFLGSSETIGRHEDLFQTLSKRWRIYRRIGKTRYDRVDFPSSVGTAARHGLEAAVVAKKPDELKITHLAQQHLLHWLAPSAVVVDREWRILYIYGNVDPYLTHAPGIPSDNLLQQCRRELRSKLRGTVHKAFHEQRPVSVVAKLPREGKPEKLQVTVQPMQRGEEERELALVVFEEEGAHHQRPPTLPSRRTPPPRKAAKAEAEGKSDEHFHEEVIGQLEDELAATKEDLQATIEQLETSNEEFKASNEEVMSINEELQSANEELETSREELQSLNEELSTVNNQLADKIDKLESTNADLTNLMAATDVATVCLDTGLRIRWFTQAAKRIVRLSESDEGRPISDLSHDFADSDLATESQKVLDTLIPAEAEVHCEDGRYFLRRITPYRVENHTIRGVVITFVDITVQKQREFDLARLAIIVEQSSDAIVSKSLEGTIFTWNRGAEQLYGYSAQEAIGKNVAMIYPKNKEQEWADILERVSRGEQILPFETTRLHKSGKTVEVSVAVSPVRDRQGQIVGASTIARDISPIKAAVATANENMRLAVEGSPVAMLMVDASGKIILVNSQTEKQFGYAREELLGLSVERLVPQQLRGKHQQYRKNFFLKPEARSMGEGIDLYGVRKDGSEFPDEIGLNPVETGAGPCVLASILDISRRKGAEADLIEARRAAEAANQAKSEFLANMSHEIRTPMTAILGYLDLIAQHPDDPDRMQWIETVRRNGRSLLDLINDILDLSRIEAGKLQVHREQLALNPLLADLHALMSVRAEEKGLSFVVEALNKIPETIESDPTRLRQILVNLVGNAIKFTDSGHVRVTLQLLREEEKLQFSVSDTGVGIPRDEQARLFQPFSQADSSPTRAHQGAGLGLNISQRLVGMLGGEIRFSSEPGRGSTFRFSIDTGPLQKVELTELNLEQPRYERPRPPRLPACKVLVVDDARANRHLIKRLLETAGAQVEAAGDGKEAIDQVHQAIAEDEPFEVIVMDMQMPVLDGYQAATQLRQEGVTTPIVALTAHAMGGDREKCMSVGCNDYLAKPLEQSVLIDAILRHLPAGTQADS